MAPVAVDLCERRIEHRRAGGARWQPDALMRPGQRVTLINICSRAALVESPSRLRPGAHTEMQLVGLGVRTSVKGRLERCFVAGLEPLRYRGVLMFAERVEIGDEPNGLE